MYPNGRKLQDTGYVTLFLKDSGRYVTYLVNSILYLSYRRIRFSPANVRAHVKFSVVDVRGDHTNSKVRRPIDCLYVSNLGSRFFL